MQRYQDTKSSQPTTLRQSVRYDKVWITNSPSTMGCYPVLPHISGSLSILRAECSSLLSAECGRKVPFFVSESPLRGKECLLSPRVLWVTRAKFVFPRGLLSWNNMELTKALDEKTTGSLGHLACDTVTQLKNFISQQVTLKGLSVL